MKSGMLAAEAIAEKLKAGSEGGDVLTALPEKFKASWLFDELDRSRSFGAAIHKFGALIGGTINWIEKNIFGGKAPWRSEEKPSELQSLMRISFAVFCLKTKKNDNSKQHEREQSQK